MKIFGNFQVLAAIISSAEAYSTAEKNRRVIFDGLATDFFRQDFVHEVVKVKYPKFWKKWTNNKAAQFQKLGEKSKKAFERCGENFE